MLASALMSFGLKQLIGEGADQLIGFVQSRLQDPSQALPRALTQAHDQAWQALELALDRDGLQQRIAAYFTTTSAVRGWAEQARQFLQSEVATLPCPSEEFRNLCLKGLREARSSGMLTVNPAEMQDLSQQASDFRRYNQPQQLIDNAWLVVESLADFLAVHHSNLAHLLCQRSDSGPPLLVSAFSDFLHLEIAHNPELHHRLTLDALHNLCASQEHHFAALQQAFSGQVLDLREEMQRLMGLQLGGTEQVQHMLREVLERLDKLGMQKTEVQLHYSCSIRSEQERQAVRDLLDRYRELPEEQSTQVPALLNGLGILQMGAGDFAGAQQSFRDVAQNIDNNLTQGKAYYNSYRAALEQRQWDGALSALLQATGPRTSHFPWLALNRYGCWGQVGSGLCFCAGTGSSRIAKSPSKPCMVPSWSDVWKRSSLKHTR